VVDAFHFPGGESVARFQPARPTTAMVSRRFFSLPYLFSPISQICSLPES
jgi:hypothetical protein